jgi:hypothetical protein
MKQPGSLTIGVISVSAGSLFTFVFLWLFGIEISSFERFKTFPEGWSVFELAYNAFAVILLVGASRAVFKGIQEYYNPSNDDVPPVGGPF